MARNNAHMNNWMRPLSWLYRFGVWIRSLFFQLGIYKQHTYEIPIICVGNLAVGGTGKTPHIEYLIRLLGHEYRVAVVSRGYKRKTRGLVIADENSTAREIGDEPYQMKLKFRNVIFAVDSQRRRAIEHLLDLPMAERPEVILLDDAYQHRSVTPSFSILLTDYNRPYFEDCLLPMGRLREPISNATLANFVVATKCPKEIKPIDLRVFLHGVNIYPYQSLIFTSIIYGKLVSLFEGEEKTLDSDQLSDKEVLLVVGIASPRLMIEELEGKVRSLEKLIYPDHHAFKKKNIREINEKFAKIDSPNKIIITTEKDAARLLNASKLSDEVKAAMYTLPIEISFVTEEGQKLFNKKILDHVRKNSGNSSIRQK